MQSATHHESAHVSRSEQSNMVSHGLSDRRGDYTYILSQPPITSTAQHPESLFGAFIPKGCRSVDYVNPRAASASSTPFVPSRAKSLLA